MSTFQAGQVINRGFSIWFKNLAPFSLMALLIYSDVDELAEVFS